MRKRQRKQILSKQRLPRISVKLHTSTELTTKALGDSIRESIEWFRGCATSDVRSLDISQQYHELLAGVAGAQPSLIDWPEAGGPGKIS